MTLVKSSSAILVLHMDPSTELSDLMLETLKRTELLLFLCTTLDRLSLPRPALVQTQALRFISSTATA